MTRPNLRVAQLALLCWCARSCEFASAADYPAGEHAVAATIETGNLTGGRIVGVGSAPLTKGKQRAEVTDMVAATKVSPLILVNGQDFRLEHVSLNGSTWATRKVRGDVGVLLHRTGEGLATGRVYCEDVAINHFHVGLQFGEMTEEAQCAESDWNSLSISGCAVGVRSVTKQALGHAFRSLRFFDCPVGVQIEGGGKLLVDHLFTPTPGCTLVKFAPTDKTSLGLNAGKFEFRNVFLDRQAIGARLLDMAPGFAYFAQIEFDGGVRASDDDTKPTFTVCGQTRLVIRDYVNPGTISWDAGKHAPSILLENCCLPTATKAIDALRPELSRGSVLLLARNCYTLDGKQVANWSKAIQGTAK